jgi:DNA adenine methylase
MDKNELAGGEYVEVYAGGAGVALGLLVSGHASKVHINDLDPAIFAFWKSVLENTNDLCRKIRDVPMDLETWKRQRSIVDNPQDHSSLDLGFAAFYLNRTNRSGILMGGLIGGKDQTGPWKMDARFNREALCLKVEAISCYSNQVSLHNLDAEVLLNTVVKKLPSKSLVYFDPPYYVKAQRLYRDHYKHADHERLAAKIGKLKTPWVVSYDDVEEIRTMYAEHRRLRYKLSYSAGARYAGAEVLFTSPGLKLPKGADPMEWRAYA